MSLRDGYFFQEVGKHLEPGREAEALFDAGCGTVWNAQKAVSE